MHLARWLIAATLLTGLVAPLAGCRNYVRLPEKDPILTPDSGSGGRGGTGGGSGTSGVGGNDPTDAPSQPSDTRLPDRPPPDGMLPPDMAECGLTGGRCCPGGRCANNGCCVNGECTQAFTFMSCPGVAASCTGMSCGGICGGLRESCCGDAGYCVRALTVCVRTDGGARCESCGVVGNPCCPENYCEAGRCMNGRCI